MDLKHLHSFCVVAEEGHVTRAAKRLSLAQPALTQQMKAFEADLGVQLFRKKGRGIELTQTGRFLQKEGLLLLQQMRQIEENVREVEGHSKGCITIALADVETVAACVTGILKVYRERNDGVAIREVILLPEEIPSALRDGRIDAAFACGTVPDLHDVTRYCLEPGYPVVAVPLDHPFAQRAGISLKELAAEPFILLSHGELPGSFETRLRARFADQQLATHILEVTPHLLIALNMVASGAGIALVPESVVGMRKDAIAYIRLTEEPSITVEYALYLRRQEKAADLVLLKELSVETQVKRPREGNSAPPPA